MRLEHTTRHGARRSVLRTLTTTILSSLALGLAVAGPAAASADEQQAVPPSEQYAYDCGHLGSSCGDEEQPRRSRSQSRCAEPECVSDGASKPRARAKKTRSRCTRRAARGGARTSARRTRRCSSRRAPRANPSHSGNHAPSGSAPDAG